MSSSKQVRSFSRKKYSYDNEIRIKAIRNQTCFNSLLPQKIIQTQTSPTKKLRSRPGLSDGGLLDQKPFKRNLGVTSTNFYSSAGKINTHLKKLRRNSAQIGRPKTSGNKQSFTKTVDLRRRHREQVSTSIININSYGILASHNLVSNIVTPIKKTNAAQRLTPNLDLIVDDQSSATRLHQNRPDKLEISVENSVLSNNSLSENLTPNECKRILHDIKSDYLKVANTISNINSPLDFKKRINVDCVINSSKKVTNFEYSDTPQCISGSMSKTTMTRNVIASPSKTPMSAHNLNGSSSPTIIDKDSEDSNSILTVTEIKMLYYSRIIDLDMKFNQQQLQRFIRSVLNSYQTITNPSCIAVPYIHKNTYTGTLKLTNLGLGMESALSLSILLQNNRALKRLYLCSNNLGNEGVSIIAKVLNHKTWYNTNGSGRSTELIHLSLASNKINNKGE